MFTDISEEALQYCLTYCKLITQRTRAQKLSPKLQRDKKRAQYKVGFNSYETRDGTYTYSPLLEEAVAIIAHMFPNHTVEDCMILKSEPDSLPQYVHSDGDPSVQNNFPSFACIYCPEKSKIEMMRDDKGKQSLLSVELGKNSIIIFNSKAEHAGSGYETENYRLHMFLDYKFVQRKQAKREKDKTYPSTVVL